MKSPTPEIDKRAPLSYYLREEDEDGWTVFSSDDEQTEIKLNSKPERSPDLSVLKRIKNFLSEEGTQDGSFLSSDEGDAPQNFRVDYPFYDACSEEDALTEPARFEANDSVQDVEVESPCVDQSARVEVKSVETTARKEIESTNDGKSKKPQGDKTNASVLEFEPVVLQVPETQTPSASNKERLQRSKENEKPTPPTTFEIPNDPYAEIPATETQDANSTDAENVVEESEGTLCENAFEATKPNSPAEESVESESREAENVPNQTSEANASPQTFVVDFSETLAPVLERRAQGEEIKEPPLVPTESKRRNRSKKESVKNAKSASEESSDVPFVETQEEPIAKPGFERPQRGDSRDRMAIFRRCVDLVSQRVNATNVPTTDKVEAAQSAPESDLSSFFDYGESVAFVSAPCFCDLGAVASFETTTFGVLPR